jgi:hypothetical protein
MSLTASKHGTKVCHYGISRFLLDVGHLQILTKADSEWNKKKLAWTWIHFLRVNDLQFAKSAIIRFMYNLIAQLIMKRLFYIFVNP